MRTRFLTSIFLLLSFLSFAQKGGRSSFHPSYHPPAKPHVYEPHSTPKEFSVPENYDYRVHESKPSISFPRISETSEKSIYKYLASYKDGEFVVVDEEGLTKNISITENNNTITIEPNSTLKNQNVELVLSEDIWKKGKKIRTEYISLKIFAENRRIYDIEQVTIDNGEIRHMAKIKEGVWIDPTKSDIGIVNKNLERNFDKNLVQVISIVNDFKTNKILKEEIGSKSINCKSKKDLIKRINSLSDGSTIFIIGHQERGKFVTHDEKGEILFELTSSEIDQIITDKNINIFPLGCKTAFSEFNEGANIDLNSVKLVKSLSKSLSSSTSFGEILQNITELDPDLRFLVENNSFGAIKIEVLKKTNIKFKPKHNQNDSTEIENKKPISSKAIKTIKIGGGYIFVSEKTSPYLANLANIDTHILPPMSIPDNNTLSDNNESSTSYTFDMTDITDAFSNFFTNLGSFILSYCSAISILFILIGYIMLETKKYEEYPFLCTMMFLLAFMFYLIGKASAR